MNRLVLVNLLLLTWSLGAVAQDLDMERLTKGTVMVLPMVGQSPDNLEMGESLGSGTILDTKMGLVITNYHVVFDDELDLISRYATIAVPISLEQAPVPCFLFEVLEASSKKDIALLRYVKTLPGAPITLQDLPSYNLEDPSRFTTVAGLKLNSPLIAIGYPGYQQSLEQITLTVTNGKISGFLSDEEVPDLAKAWIKTDALVSWGNSGGTVIDSTGRFIGIPTQVMLDSQGGRLGRLRPVDLVLPLYQKALGNPLLAWAGVGDLPPLVKVSSLTFIQKKGDKKGSFLPGSTMPLSPDQELSVAFHYEGLKKGQKIRLVWRVNGTKVSDDDELSKVQGEGEYMKALDLSGIPLPEGEYELALSIGGNRVTVAGFTVTRSRSTKWNAIDLSGTVTDSLTAKPVPNARVAVLKDGVTLKKFYDAPSTALVLAYATCDSTGHWKISQILEKGKTYAAFVNRDGYENWESDTAIRIGNDDKAPKPLEFKVVKE